MEPVVHENGAAAKRLAELAPTAGDLIGALIGADQEARTWTPLAPPMMAGLARWGKTNELLRARLVERGWSHDNPKGLPRTISPARDFAIVATTGDAGDDLATWLLLYHVTPDQVRAELSLGNAIDRRGHVSEWIERIILPALRTDECSLDRRPS
jgi:hypothetical protein